MTWEKLGLIQKPNPEFYWSKSYASVPTPIVIGDKVRVYYATRDAFNESRITFSDFDINDPTKLIKSYNEISLDVGPLGSFDENGVQPTKVIFNRNQYYMYYAGYRLVNNGYYDLFTGLAISHDGEKFNKAYETPILDRTSGELTVRVGATVTFDKYYRLFYIASSGWFTLPGGKKCPKYKMMFDTSPWESTFEHQECVMEPEGDEIGFSRPWANSEDLYYAVRKFENEGNPYVHIERASFKDDRVVRTKEIVLERSGGENMVCFPAVIDLPSGKFMFYNSSNYGEAGIHLAKFI